MYIICDLEKLAAGWRSTVEVIASDGWPCGGVYRCVDADWWEVTKRTADHVSKLSLQTGAEIISRPEHERRRRATREKGGPA